MSRRRAAVKGAVLLAPLFVAVLALHAWGDPAARGLTRGVGLWQYPERSRGVFQVRVPRRSDDADVFAAKTLDDFISKTVKAHGATLILHPPLQPVKVVLLDDTTEVKRFGWTAAENLKENEGVFDAASRTIFVRMQRKLQQEPVTAALQLGAARLLLHDCGSERWEPWLTEGLIGRLEGNGAGLRTWTGDTPLTLKDLLTARPADFQGRNGPSYVRGARLLVAYLTEKRTEDFAKYYKAVRMGSANAQEIFEERFFDQAHLEGEWRDWIRAQK
jgi:hypothetical protein